MYFLQISTPPFLLRWLQGIRLRLDLLVLSVWLLILAKLVASDGSASHSTAKRATRGILTERKKKLDFLVKRTRIYGYRYTYSNTLTAKTPKMGRGGRRNCVTHT